MSAPSFSSFPDIFQPPSASTSQSQPGSSTEHHPRTFQNRDREKPRRSKEESYAPRHGSDRRRDRYDHEDDAYRRRRREEKAAKRQIKAEAEDLLQEVLGPRLLEEDRPRRPDLPSSAFWDTAGDRAAVTYGDSVSRSAPRYRRSGDGTVLGLHPGLRIVHNRDRTDKGVEIAPLGRAGTERYDGHSADSVARQLRRYMLQPREKQDFSFTAPFIGFDIHHSRKAAAIDLPEYRSISRQEDNEELETTALDGLPTVEEHLRRRDTEMERHLQDHPGDVEVWIRYSTAHLKLSSLSRSAEEMARHPQTRAQAEVTMSILSRSFEAAPANFLSAKLHIAYLEAAENVWSASKVSERWRSVLRELNGRVAGEASMVEIWQGYLDWREGAGFGKIRDKDTSDGLEDLIGAYTGCIADLSVRLAHSEDRSALECALSHIFLRACLALKLAGYIERAMAAFQAMIEITFFRPGHLRPVTSGPSPRFEQVLDEFELFWEDELARFGEEGAEGWKDTTSQPLTQPRTSSTPIVTEDPFAHWLAAERQAEVMAALPSRSTEEDDGDPFRVVLFSDVRDLLFPLSSVAAQQRLIYAFFNFVGFPIDAPGTSSTAKSDPRLDWRIAYNGHLRSQFWPSKVPKKALAWQTVGGEPMEPEAPVSAASPFSCPVRVWLSDPGTRIGPATAGFRDLASSDLVTLDIAFLRRCLRLLQDATDSSDVKILLLSVESVASPKNGLKVGKRLLDKDRDNLRLWSAFGRLEGQPPETSRVIFENALRSVDTLPTNRNMAVLHALCSEWAMNEMERGMPQNAFRAVARGAGQSDSESQLIQLKVKQYYAGLVPRDVCAATLKVLHSYLASGIEDARVTLQNALPIYPSSSAHAEELWQRFCQILYLHTTRQSTPAWLFREIVEDALRLFPQNTQFLSLYYWSQLRDKVHGRIQKHVTALTTGEVSLTGLLWSVWAEAHMSSRTFWQDDGAGAERVRVVLSRGIATRAGRQSVSLWRLFIEFESMLGRYTAAKQLCYRAIASVGGCKEICLLPFDAPLRNAFSNRELQQWAELMLERGIRCHIPFEQYWSVDEPVAGEMEMLDEEELQDDELAFLRERRALLPY